MITAHLKMARLFAEGAGELHVQFELAPGSLTALVGPSGSGKTTLLRLLSGLETPIQGRIQVDDTIWLDSQQNVNLRPQQRSVGYIFQDAALFPNLTVRENILFVTPKGETGRADELISATGLGPFVHKKPTALSGGQQQRVALARALVRRPWLLLLDEPFAALDEEAARQLREVLLGLHRAWKTTTLLVSHHPDDVQALADRVIRLSQGQIVTDQPQEVIRQAQGEQIERVWYDQTHQQWIIQTATFQLRSANPAWGQLSVGTFLNLYW